MFVTELQPLAKELVGQPVAFVGGFVSGIFRLNLSDSPLKDWLEKQGIDSTVSSTTSDDDDKPQSITIE